MKAVLITDDVHPVFLEGLQQLGFRCDYRPEITVEQTRRVVGDYHGLVINSKIKVDRRMLEAAPKLKFIARLGSGLDIIDLPATAERGIKVVAAPEGNCNAVAEHALGMLLALLNRLHLADSQVRQFVWQRELNRGRELMGMTIGVVGFGHTGQAFVGKLLGLGVKVLVHDRFKTLVAPHDGTYRVSTLEQIQTEADVISLHVDLNDTTRHLVDRSFIEGFSKSFYLINTSRGKVVNLEALLWGLHIGRLAGACLDVYENERVSAFSSIEKELYSHLYQFQQVLLTPHIAGWTFESKLRIAVVLMSKLQDISWS